jgi:hypothetical protein
VTVPLITIDGPAGPAGPPPWPRWPANLASAAIGRTVICDRYRKTYCVKRRVRNH